MSSGGKKNKQKWKTVPVEDIFSNIVVRPNPISWADEVEDNEYMKKRLSNITLPTAPRAACDVVIDESKIPTNGPFTAYLTNLPYESTEDDVIQVFKDKELKVLSARLPNDSRTERMKGFGFVEFQDKSNLIIALSEGQLKFGNRTVRISLPPEDDGKGGARQFNRNRDNYRSIEGSSDSATDWRAGVPVPMSQEKSGFGRSSNRREGGGFGGGGGGGGGFASSGGSRPFRESGRYEPPSEGSAFGRSTFGDRDRDGGSRPGFGGGRRFERGSSSGSASSAFGARRGFDNDREFVRRDDRKETETPEEPKTRPKLVLQPRSVVLDTNQPASLPPSIFGGARPVDTRSKELELEEKLKENTTLSVTRGGPVSPRARSPRSNSPRTRSPSSRSSSASSIKRTDSGSKENLQPPSQNGDSKNDSDDTKRHEGFKEPLPPTTNAWLRRRQETKANAKSAETEAILPKPNVDQETKEPRSEPYRPPRFGGIGRGASIPTRRDDRPPADRAVYKPPVNSARQEQKIQEDDSTSISSDLQNQRNLEDDDSSCGSSDVQKQHSDDVNSSSVSADLQTQRISEDSSTLTESCDLQNSTKSKLPDVVPVSPPAERLQEEESNSAIAENGNVRDEPTSLPTDGSVGISKSSKKKRRRKLAKENIEQNSISASTEDNSVEQDKSNGEWIEKSSKNKDTRSEKQKKTKEIRNIEPAVIKKKEEGPPTFEGTNRFSYLCES